MRTGSVTINGGMFFGLTSPFGGIKQIGLGRRNGAEDSANIRKSRRWDYLSNNGIQSLRVLVEVASQPMA